MESMELDTLKALYVDELKDLWSAEQQIIKALPKVIKAAKSKVLKDAFRKHLKQTREQRRRLEEICRALEVSPRGKKCVGMEGLLKEASELIRERPDPEVLDAGLITVVQHVEHYEIAGYGTARTWARVLGLRGQANTLQRTLNEEGAADHLLTRIALKVNVAAKN
jgi:ferritin-like metal-binding protein YciE